MKHFNHSLTVLRDALVIEATRTGDGLSQSDGYFQCMPSSIDPKYGEIKAATIGLRVKTNVNFSIIISALDGAGHRHVNISCASGQLQLVPGWGDDFYVRTEIYPDIVLDTNTPLDRADQVVFEPINSLVEAQILNSSNTNK